MSSTPTFAPGGYRYIPGVFQYSGGVAAQPGFRIERVRFSRTLPLAEGFARIEAYLADAGHPLAAFCACELRSPGPFSEAGFEAFNRVYVGTLSRWGVYDGAANPVARSNVCPAIDPPFDPGFHAFCHTVPGVDAAPSFVIAGSGEAPEGRGSYREHTIAFGDVSPQGMRRKAQWVLGEMERRMAALGFGWRDATATQVYTVQDIHPLMASELGPRGLLRDGLTWHFNRPPVDGLEYEMDCRAVALERVLTV